MPALRSYDVTAPAGYITPQLITFARADGAGVPVSGTDPMPVRTIGAAAISTPLAGNANTSQAVGPFTPELGRPIWLSLSGTWAGSVQVLRSTDGGVTRLPLTAGGQSWGRFTANCNEPVAEESDAAASYYLQITLTSGTVTYRVAQ